MRFENYFREVPGDCKSLDKQRPAAFVDAQGNLVNTYSIVGKPEWFKDTQQKMVKNGSLQQLNPEAEECNETSSCLNKSKSQSRITNSQFSVDKNQLFKKKVKILDAGKLLSQEQVRQEIQAVTEHLNKQRIKNSAYNQIILDQLDKGDQLYLTHQNRIQDKFHR